MKGQDFKDKSFVKIGERSSEWKRIPHRRRGHVLRYVSVTKTRAVWKGYRGWSRLQHVQQELTVEATPTWRGSREQSRLMHTNVLRTDYHEGWEPSKDKPPVRPSRHVAGLSANSMSAFTVSTRREREIVLTTHLLIFRNMWVFSLFTVDRFFESTEHFLIHLGQKIELEKYNVSAESGSSLPTTGPEDQGLTARCGKTNVKCQSKEDRIC